MKTQKIDEERIHLEELRSNNKQYILTHNKQPDFGIIRKIIWNKVSPVKALKWNSKQTRKEQKTIRFVHGYLKKSYRILLNNIYNNRDLVLTKGI